MSRFSVWIQFVIKTTCEYRFDSIVTKAANNVKDICPNTYTFYKCGNQTFEHWLLNNV